LPTELAALNLPATELLLPQAGSWVRVVILAAAQGQAAGKSPTDGAANDYDRGQKQ
jgi:hypothetical protein